MYIHADSSEQGDIEFIDTHTKVVANFPHSPRTPCSFPIEPKTGKLILFPSGLMHMVAPNVTPNERYSISFNMEFHGRDIPKLPDWDENEFLFNIDKDGNPIIE